MGLPRAMDGHIGPQAEKVTAFTEALRQQLEVPLEYRDERLTTVSARRMMREANSKRTRDDAIAAAVILQAYLDETTPEQSQ